MLAEPIVCPVQFLCFIYVCLTIINDDDNNDTMQYNTISDLYSAAIQIVQER